MAQLLRRSHVVRRQLSGSPIITFGYTRDDGGRITTKTETVNGQTSTTSYGYDPAGRLTDVTTGTATTHYGYDDNGNRTSLTTASATIAATYDAQDRMTTYNGASYFYSDNGELQKKIDAQGTTLYNYDVLGNLRSVTLPDGRLIEYVIDASNRRVGKRINGTLVAGWIYADQLRIIAETDGSGTVTKRFVYGSRTNVPAYMIWQGNSYRIITDQLGSPRYVLDASGGTLAESIGYDEYGKLLSDTNPGFVPFGFAGGLYDHDTGLTRFGTRDYDANTGRWTATDPLLFNSGSSNLYGYGWNDPINLLDIDGRRVYPADFVGPLRPGDVRAYSADLNDPRLLPLQLPPYPDAGRYYGESHQCVAFTKYFSGAPQAKTWKKGPKVIGNDIPPGTAVATFNDEGSYENADHGNNSGIYLWTNPDGSIVMMDQWTGHYPQARTVYPNRADASDNSNSYSVITTPGRNH